MSIIDTITNPYHFWEWLKESNYKNSFSQEGAYAVQKYYEELSEEIGEPIEFDPIAWCVAFTEENTLDHVLEQYDNINSLKELEERTTVLQLEGGKIVFEEF